MIRPIVISHLQHHIYINKTMVFYFVPNFFDQKGGTKDLYLIKTDFQHSDDLVI